MFGSRSVVLVILISFVNISCGPGKIGRNSGGSLTPETGESAELPDASRVISDVSERYSKLTYYSARGLNLYTATRYWGESKKVATPFEIEHNVEEGSTIKWHQDMQSKVFRYDKEKTWLEVNGEVTKEFRDLRDGLMSVSLLDGVVPLFLVDSFVFHEEIMRGHRYFAEVVDPEVTGEAELNGRRCYLLAGGFKGVTGKTVYWIDAENHLVRRIERTIIVRSRFLIQASTAYTSETYFDIEIK